MDLNETIRRFVMAGVGAVSLTFEKSKDLADALVKKGEETAAENNMSYEQVRDQVDAPILVQLVVRERAPRQGGPTPENPYYCADAMEGAAVKLYAAGVQFLRATGQATPAYTGALVATVSGLDVRL